MKRTRYRMRMLIAAAVMLLGCRVVSAGTVVWSSDRPSPDEVSFGCSNGSGSFSWSMLKSAGVYGIVDAYAYMSFTLSNTGVVSPSKLTLAARGTNARKLNEGDEVSYDSTFGNDKTYFYHELPRDESYEAGWVKGTSVVGTQNEPLILGFATVNDGWYEHPEYGEYIYGWVKLIYDGTDLRMDSAAVAIGDDIKGIYAGTGNLIPKPTPEPCTAALLALGVCACALRRKDAA